MVAIDSDLQGYKEAERILREGIDCIAGGFPCQDVSIGGKRAGIQFDESTNDTPTRSGLFWEMVRAVRMARPRRWIMENVAGIFDGHLGGVLREVARSGYDAEWDCLSSGRIGRGHLRERFYAIAYPCGERLQGGEQRLQEDKNEGNIHASLFPPLPLRPAPSIHDLPKPYVIGKDDGIPDRSHRIKCLGNAVDPEIIEHIGKVI